MESVEILQESQSKKIPQSATEWQGWIEKNVENFEGKKDNAALLMQSFIEGINYIKEQTATGIVKDFQYPNINITASDGTDPRNIYCAEDGRNIYIKKNYLEEASNFDINSMRTAFSENNEIVYKATTNDMFLLTGIEEAHHASLLQGKLKTTNYNSKNSAAEYNADEAEYQALKWKVRYSEEKHMPPETISLLKKQLNEAISVRRQPIA